MGTPNIPFILSGQYFSIVSCENQQIIAECRNCKSSTLIKGSSAATSNFVTHLNRVHPELKSEYEAGKTVHSKKRKFGHSSIHEVAGLGSFVIKDPQRTVTRIEKLLINFVVHGMHALSVIEELHFIKLCEGLNPDVKLMTRPTLTKKINIFYEDSKLQMREILSKHEYLCLTADMWTCAGMSRSFMGVTVHWIDRDFKRGSMALACRRFMGSHTYDRIAEVLSEIIKDYGIEMSKIVNVVTDNASNFKKAFETFGMEFKISRGGNGTSDERQQETCEENPCDEMGDDGDEDDDLHNLVDLDNILSTRDSDENEAVCQLPPHHKCSSHTLSLICTTDIEKRTTSKSHKSAFGKCSGIWNKTKRSTQVSEKLKEICGKKLKTPCKTRWNSLYDSLDSLLDHKEKFTAICSAVNVPAFTDLEIKYLESYNACLKPISLALDRLQGEKCIYFGDLLPCLFSTQMKLVNLASTPSSPSGNLATTILNSLKKRFQEFFELSESSFVAIIAAVSHPYFKLRWIPADKRERIKEMFISSVISETDLDSFLSPSSSDKNGSSQKTPKDKMDDDDFFEFENDVENENNAIQGREVSVRQECLDYLMDFSKELMVLRKYPRVEKVFIKYNTSLPSSAAVERLFSFSGLILRSKRMSLSDDLFEKLTILKYSNV